VDRLACVDAAALPLQLLLRAHPDWVQQPVAPVAVIDADRPQGLVLWLNERARRAGVRPGQRYATALALAQDLRAAVVTPAEIDESVRALSDCLRHYSPHVEPSTVTPGVFWLDASGLNRLYSSMQDWASAVRLELQRAGVRATVAVGVSRFGSYALAKFHHGITICLDAGEERAAVDRVPLSALDLDPNARERLSALGIETVGDFLRLPGDAVRQRLGTAADVLYQLASGRRWAPLVPAPPEVIHERELLFDTPETSTERVLFVVKRLLDSLVAALAEQSLAIVDLELNLTLDDRSTRVEHVRPASPTLDAVHLLTLVRLRLDAIRLSSGITTLRVTAETCNADPLQLRLLQQARRDPDAAHQACARLRAEFGEDAVVRARLCDAHLPGARFVWERFDRMPMQTAARVVTARPLVRRIFAKPEARSPEPGAHMSGPYILSGGWWGGGLHRDYYFAETGEGALWWMYYDHRQKRFYLQGGVE
jgi:protein ImuB